MYLNRSKSIFINMTPWLQYNAPTTQTLVFIKLEFYN
jgi:hypothetical protein